MNKRNQTQYPEFYRNDQLELSVVIPLFNEHEVLGLMYEKLKTVITPLRIRYELLFVDDGSHDGTAHALATLSTNDPSVTVVFLARHFGKESALAAGLAQAGGRAVVIMDGDMQDPPEAIPRMLNAWHHGTDVVRMKRQRLIGETPFRHYAGLCLDHILNAIFDLGMPADSIDFMLFSQEAATALGLVAQRRRHMASMFAWAGFRETVLEYQRSPRAAGTHSWSPRRHIPDFSGKADCHTIIETLLRGGMLCGLIMMLTSLLYACFVMAAITGGGFFNSAAPALFFWGGLLFFSGGACKHVLRCFRQARHPQYDICRLERAHAATTMQHA
ncbi:glycosyltransferase [Pollutimonas harenae]|uniref:Glycosyltransferase n=1 Tax=Pollutimonas harenae TaxID=657015 RepID=A0A853GXG1_9BURK|nr:glycosyltransferase [Pollutimonas harenae]NYT84822.1 glycosyltransferase [Pollutimonas harenae]TEA72780.1 glycosyltransferase [Pollutimonas harenae]